MFPSPAVIRKRVDRTQPVPEIQRQTEGKGRLREVLKGIDRQPWSSSGTLLRRVPADEIYNFWLTHHPGLYSSTDT